MDAPTALARLKAHEPELRALGIARLSLFGSVARGEARADSDVDLAAELDPAKSIGIFGFFAIEDRLRDILGISVDLVGEPASKPRIQTEIDRDRVHVF